jgi:hypothetical protein
MNQNMVKFGQVRESVINQAKNFHDEIVPLKDVQFDSLKSVRIGDQQHPLRMHGAMGMAARLHVPHSYLERCDGQLQAINLNYWVEKQKANSSDLFIRFDGDEVRAVFSTRYRALDNIQIINELAGLGITEDADVQCYMDDKFMMLNIPSPSRKLSLLKRDEVMPGVSVSNSEIGLASFSVAAFMLRLICTNGMISKSHMAKTSYRHVSTKVLEQLPTILQDATSSLDLLTHSLKEAAKVKVEDPEEKIVELNEQYMLNDNQKEAVIWAIPQEIKKTNSMYNIIQVFTRAVQHSSLNSLEKYRLQSIGGEIAANF